MQTPTITGFYEFADFRLDVPNRLLWRGEKQISLTIKEFDVLLVLVENAGRVLTKDELLEAVWADTFVEEATLARNVSWLRKKLSADGGTENFIETLPKRGYRFAAQVATSGAAGILIEETTLTRVSVEETITLPEIINAETNRSSEFEKEAPALVSAERRIALAPNVALSKSAMPRRSFLFLLAALALFAAASIGFIVRQNYFAPTNATARFAANVKPFSGAPGRENTPAFSPDSKQIAFSWNGGERENADIYVQIIGAGEPVRLTDTDVQEHYPVFSPDGTYVAFVRDLKTHGEIILIPAFGGAERTVARVFSGNYSISFAPDGKSIAVVDAISAGGKQYAIFTIDVKTGERRRVTGGGDFAGETTPRYSPDGKSLAFVGVFPGFTQDLYVVSTTGEANEPLRLTSDLKTIHSLAWSADGAEIFFVSLRESIRSNIWRVAATGGAPEFLSTGGDFLTNLAASPDGKSIAYVENAVQSDIYRLSVGDSHVRPLIATSYIEDMPDFSPDGARIVFRSSRLGSSEAWIADADGKNLRQITDSTGQVAAVRFSPDGTSIAFQARNGENTDIYAALVEGGEPRRLTDDAASDSTPAWSADGKYIYFASDRTGENQIWRVPSTGGDAVQITRGGGFESFASPDGKWIYYTKNSPEIGLRRISTSAIFENSDEALIPKVNDEGFQNIWTLTKNGVYFTARSDDSPAVIKFYDSATERISRIAETDRFNSSASAGMTVSPDGKTILFAQFDQNASSIMLAEISK